MSNKPLNISDEAKVQMPMKTVLSLLSMVAIGTWAYFGVIETQNKISTRLEFTEYLDSHNLHMMKDGSGYFYGCICR